jgi:hypothetical protein
MPFVSKAQQRFAHANPKKFGGQAKLKEWDEATDFKNLPGRRKFASGMAKAKTK